jgi:hypothetical protein
MGSCDFYRGGGEAPACNWVWKTWWGEKVILDIKAYFSRLTLVIMV